MLHTLEKKDECLLSENRDAEIKLLNKMRIQICKLKISSSEQLLLLSVLSEVKDILATKNFDQHHANKKFKELVNSLNNHLKQNGFTLRYHNKLLNIPDDEIKKTPELDKSPYKILYKPGALEFEEIIKADLAEQKRSTLFNRLFGSKNISSTNAEQKRKASKNFI